MNPAVNEILTQYDSLSAIIAQIPKNTKNYAELQKLWESFGEALHLFLLGYIEEVNELNKKLKVEGIEYEERIKQLEGKLAELEAAIPKADFEFSERVCQKEYAKVWDLLENNTKVFLTTAYYINKLVQSSGVDFSIVIIECSKALEGELHLKLYVPYYQYRTKPLPQDGGKFGKFMNSIIAGEISEIPFMLMFSVLKPPGLKINDYYNDFQQFVRNENWNYRLLNNPTFYAAGIEYTQNYRNEAAHKGIVSFETAQKCKRKTKSLLVNFLSAYPKK